MPMPFWARIMDVKPGVIASLIRALVPGNAFELTRMYSKGP